MLNLGKALPLRTSLGRLAATPLIPRLTSTSELHTSSVLQAWGYENQPNPRGKHRPNKHFAPEWRKARVNRVYKIKLPDFERDRRMGRENSSPAEERDFMKELGQKPITEDEREYPIYISCTGAVMEPYEPPEGDGRASMLSKEGAKKGLGKANMKRKTFMATRKIRQYEEEFDPKSFVDEAQEKYIKAHKALAKGDHDELLLHATEKALPEMVHNTKRKTIHWEFIKSLEPPRIVQSRTIDVITKENIYAQVTVRMNTQQILVVYDRFGRLIHGSPTVAKDVLEYVIFEKHLANIYGTWRMHGKVTPNWSGAKPAGILTRVIPPESLEPEEEEVEVAEEGESFKQEEEEAKEGEETTLYDRFGKAIGKSK